MRIAVISDIHGNAHALNAVLEDVAQQAPDAVWCLGDLVGYGPRPNRCTTLVAAHADLCLAGNHDLGVLGTIEISEFSRDADVSARWTRDVLEPESREYLAGLAPARRTPRAELYHASPRDPIWEYVVTADSALAALRDTTAPVVLVGHSHVALAIVETEGSIGGGLVEAGRQIDLAQGRWLINPGSVGQPRDGDPRAAWLLLDFRAGRGSFHRVPYDIAATQAEIHARALPEALATRLDLGA